jgi:DNA-binding transcriptional regulator YiaG
MTEAPPFSATLRKARGKAQLSQSQAALKLGIPIKTFQNWEQNRAAPSELLQTTVLSKLAE